MYLPPKLIYSFFCQVLKTLVIWKSLYPITDWEDSKLSCNLCEALSICFPLYFPPLNSSSVAHFKWGFFVWAPLLSFRPNPWFTGFQWWSESLTIPSSQKHILNGNFLQRKNVPKYIVVGPLSSPTSWPCQFFSQREYIIYFLVMLISPNFLVHHY